MTSKWTWYVAAGAIGAGLGAAAVWAALYEDTLPSDIAALEAECSSDADDQDRVIASLRHELEKEKALRAQERSGRTNAERDARVLAQKQLEKEGYNFEPIGVVSSCFADRRGTPRQGALVPGGKARIQLKTAISPTSLECLDQFSHMWVLFVFHENTNLAKVSVAQKAYPAKIAPPRLGGKKVGLFSTRTPHRPNSIGLTVVKVDHVSGRCVDISGHDLVEGTPVLDIKPFVPYDNVPDLVCPEWVAERVDGPARTVDFTPDATAQLERAIGAMRFYTSAADLQATIAQVLILDIRSVHQKRGQSSDVVYSCRVDNLVVEFETLESAIQVTKCSVFDKRTKGNEDEHDTTDANE
ncbi:Aste57867_10561 [Aphanomyces stellatus]|uniref:Aste57867_10561 protein n=1 Tax=Aphanomyces stellatus TaxID=120398 RepID=A0A485KS71_9STRA|nr:hypothetical protein As57867_010521 [Aphanomyces stellatus]VFT87434.1 Aste57867_10561 [Aphanomyces stellatus]